MSSRHRLKAQLADGRLMGGRNERPVHVHQYVADERDGSGVLLFLQEQRAVRSGVEQPAETLHFRSHGRHHSPLQSTVRRHAYGRPHRKQARYVWQYTNTTDLAEKTGRKN